GVDVRVLTRPDPAGGEPGVAELIGHRALLQPRRPEDKLVLQVNDSPVKPAPPGTIAMCWTEPPPPQDTLQPKVTLTEFSGIAATADLESRLAEVWGRSGAISGMPRPPYAFLALAHGWLQMPLPVTDPDSGDPTRTAFRGFLRLDLDKPDSTGSS